MQKIRALIDCVGDRLICNVLHGREGTTSQAALDRNADPFPLSLEDGALAYRFVHGSWWALDSCPRYDDRGNQTSR